MSDMLPAIWHVLRLLLDDSEDSHTLLKASFNDLENEFIHHPLPESIEFAPYVYDSIKKSGINVIPPKSLISYLEQYTYTAAASAAIREKILRELGIRLSSNSIQAILLKGAALHGYIYPETSFRLGQDIDILVRTEDYPYVKKILSGLASEIEKFPTSTSIKNLSVERSFISDDLPYVSLDIHREFTNPYIYNIDYNELFKRSVYHPAFEKRFRILSPEDNLIHFAIHAFYDLKMVSKHTLDAYLLTQAESINWLLLYERAIKDRTILPLVYLFEGINYVFGYKPPRDVYKLMNIGKMRHWLSRRLLLETANYSKKGSWRIRLKQLLSHWFLSGNIRGSVRYQMKYTKARLLDTMYTLYGRE